MTSPLFPKYKSIVKFLILWLLLSKAFLLMRVTHVFLIQCCGVTKVVILQKKILPSLAINKIWILKRKKGCLHILGYLLVLTTKWNFKNYAFVTFLETKEDRVTTELRCRIPLKNSRNKCEVSCHEAIYISANVNSGNCMLLVTLSKPNNECRKPEDGNFNTVKNPSKVFICNIKSIFQVNKWVSSTPFQL